MSRHAFNFNAVLYETHDQVHAQCLEVDIRCNGTTRYDIGRALAEHVVINLLLAQELGYKLDPAAPEHWNAFRRGGLYYAPRQELVTYRNQEYLVRPYVRFAPGVHHLVHR